MDGHDEMATAGSLRIGTFEGSRSRLRRTRSVMGFESEFDVVVARFDRMGWPASGVSRMLDRSAASAGAVFRAAGSGWQGSRS